MQVTVLIARALTFGRRGRASGISPREPRRSETLPTHRVWKRLREALLAGRRRRGPLDQRWTVTMSIKAFLTLGNVLIVGTISKPMRSGESWGVIDSIVVGWRDSW